MTGLQSVLKNNQIDKRKVVELEDSDVKRIQKILLGILDDILFICNKYDIKYQMSGGSTLGAVRHHGFIPWDDDIDINMPRTEIKKFLYEFKKYFGNKYWIHVPGETKGYDSMMIRIIDKRIRARGLMDPDKRECGLFIDIFIVENTYDNWILRHIHGLGCMGFRYVLSCIRFHRRSIELGDLVKDDKELNGYMRLRNFWGKILLLIPLTWWTTAASKWVQICKNNNSEYVVITAGSNQFFKELYKRSKFNKSIDAKFEGRDVKITADYDEYLTKLYGDYMIIPPENKREKHIMLKLDKKALVKFS